MTTKSKMRAGGHTAPKAVHAFVAKHTSHAPKVHAPHKVHAPKPHAPKAPHHGVPHLPKLPKFPKIHAPKGVKRGYRGQFA